MHSLWHINAPKCRPTGIRWGFAGVLSADHCITRFMGPMPPARHGTAATVAWIPLCECVCQADRKCYCNMLVRSAKKYAKYLIMNWVPVCDACAHMARLISPDWTHSADHSLSIVAVQWHSLVRFNEFFPETFCFLFSISRCPWPFQLHTHTHTHWFLWWHVPFYSPTPLLSYCVLFSFSMFPLLPPLLPGNWVSAQLLKGCLLLLLLLLLLLRGLTGAAAASATVGQSLPVR